MSLPQVAPSQFNFDVPKAAKIKKVADKSKNWVDKRPFFSGFSKETKNQKNTGKPADEKVTIRAGGYNPVSRETQRKKFNDKNNEVQGSNLVAAGIQVGAKLDENQRNSLAITQYDPQTQFAKLDIKKKKNTPGAGGFRINIKKKKKRVDDLKNLKNLD